MDEIIKKLKNKKNLNFEESKSAFENMMSGKVNEEQIYDFLTFSSAKGETSDEIAGGVYILREKASKVNVPRPVFLLPVVLTFKAFLPNAAL